MSDYDRSKYYGKKKFQAQNKDSTFARSYYGRKSPSGSYSKLEKDTSKEGGSSKSEGSSKLKQPTILIKTREHSEDVSAPSKRAQNKEHDLSTSVSAAYPNTSTSSAESQKQAGVAPHKMMTKSIKFLEDSIIFSEGLQEYLLENSDFLVVGFVGAQAVGKSTIANLMAHPSLSEILKKHLFKNNTGPNEEEYGDNIKVLTDALSDWKLSENTKTKPEIFKIQGVPEIEGNLNTTRGIDIFVTSNRVILLDCQPFISLSVLDELIQSENKRSNIVSEFIPLENSAEILNLQLTAFLMSVCHVLVVVQDWFFDSNIVRFLQTAEILKPTHSNPEDELSDHFPHLLLVQNKAQMEDFSPNKFAKIQKVYNMVFSKSKLIKDSGLGLASTGLITCIDEDTCGVPCNVFLIPQYNPSISDIYTGHPPLEEIIKKLRANILGSTKSPLTHIQLTEKTWVSYCAKVWENVRKSSFFVEYNKLMP